MKNKKPMDDQDQPYEELNAKADWEEFLDKSVVRMEREIADLFLKALKEHNGKLIIEIAKAAMFFQGKINPFIPTAHASDKEREMMITIKEFNDVMGIMGQPPVSDEVLIELLEQFTGKKIPNDSGFKRRCKEIGIQLKPSQPRRKTSHKK